MCHGPPSTQIGQTQQTAESSFRRTPLGDIICSLCLTNCCCRPQNHIASVQVALLREKLAKEQQRARAAEATLAAQHQMQQLLQSAVHAVLRARSATQQVPVHACVTHLYVTLCLRVCMNMKVSCSVT